MTTEGQGFGQDAIISTIPVTYQSGTGALPVTLFELKVSSYANPNTGGPNHNMVVATGTRPLVVVDPQLNPVSAVVSMNPLNGPSGSLNTGTALALATLNDPEIAGGGGQRNVAVLVGQGQIPNPAQSGTTMPSPVLAVA